MPHGIGGVKSNIEEFLKNLKKFCNTSAEWSVFEGSRPVPAESGLPDRGSTGGIGLAIGYGQADWWCPCPTSRTLSAFFW